MRGFRRIVLLCVSMGALACAAENSQEHGGGDGDGDGDIDSGTGDGDGDGDGDGNGDGGLDAGTDAGDGDGDGGTSDGGDGDGDGGLSDGEPPPGTGFTITTLSGGVALADQRVILHDADGTLLEDGTTDEDGRIAKLDAPGIVTVLPGVGFPFPPGGPFPIGISNMPITFYGVEAGDRLVVELRTELTSNTVGTYDITFDEGEGFAGAAWHELYVTAACAGYADDPSMATSMTVYEQCVTAQNPVLSLATDNDGLPLACAFKKNNATPSGGSPVPVALAPFVAAEEVLLSADNVPGDVTELFADLSMLASGATYYPGNNDERDFATEGVGYRYCPGFADALEAAAAAYVDGTNQMWSEFVVRQAESAAISFDFATALPRVTTASLDDATPLRPVISIETASSLSTADVGLWTWGWDVFTGETNEFVPWLLVVPPATTSVTLPELPEDAQPETGGVYLNTIQVFDLDSSQDYADFKKRPLVIAPRGGDGSSHAERPALVGNVDRLRVSGWRN
jgi:hypothetical protein